MTFEKNQLHSDTILLKTSSLFQSKNIDGFILNHLKRNENKCHNNGYVIPDSTVLVQRSIGKVVSINNQNFIQYNVNYKNKSIAPSKDDIFDCIIENITRMGIVAYLDHNVESVSDSPVLFIIPKQFIDEDTIDKFKKNDKIKIKVLDTRIKFQSKQIQVVGEYIP